jgi:hypothetical protein
MNVLQTLVLRPFGRLSRSLATARNARSGTDVDAAVIGERHQDASSSRSWCPGVPRFQ